MKTVFSSILISIVIITGSVYSYGQQSPDSLYFYLKLAAENNPVVLQRFVEYEAALKKIPQAGTLPDPQLDIGVFITPMEILGGKQVADMRLMQMFPWFGVLKNAKDEMSLMAMAKFELFRDARFQVWYDVRRTWYELYKVRKNISISEKSMENLKAIEQLTLIKYKTSAAGNSDLTDLYRIQIEAGELQNSIALLRNQEQTIVAGFNSHLNRAPLTKVYTTEVLQPDTLDLNLLAVSDSIQSGNPMLNMLDYEKEAYLAREKMVKGMGYPMIGLGVNYSFINESNMSASSMNGKDMLMPMISITLPVYRKKYTAMREEANLLNRASSMNSQAVSNSLRTEYFMAVQLYQDALRRVKLYEDQYLLATKSLEIMLKSFSASGAALTDVLRVRQQTLDYEINQVEAITDLNTAAAWLNRLMASSES
ncbi:MAG: TolC family protein [Bacteroidales bacterium]|jgi:outer membrane protein TolC|nr:TolC family protein [Bacteroidales bacterium]